MRVAIPEAHIEVTFLANDLNRSDPAALVTRLERLLQRVPDKIAELREEAATARSEADRAEARIGAPWDRTDELASLRRRQREINEQLAATSETVAEIGSRSIALALATDRGKPSSESSSHAVSADGLDEVDRREVSPFHGSAGWPGLCI